MSRSPRPARRRLRSHPAITADLAQLATYGAEVIAAARDTLDDLAHGRVTGKALGDRHVSGDLTGLASVKFDVAKSPTRRFRLVYGEIDSNTLGVLAIGPRDEHAIYRLAAKRLDVGEALDPAAARDT